MVLTISLHCSTYHQAINRYLPNNIYVCRTLISFRKKIIMATNDNLPDYLIDMNAVLKDVNCKWLNGTPPDYSLTNALYDQERCFHHTKGSLTDKVNNLIKNWEKELSYKVDISEWKTVVPSFRISVNGGDWLDAAELVKLGAYNAFLGDTEYYTASRTSPHASHQIFRVALSQGFAWECMQTYSPPPMIVLKWRHWGRATGELRCPMRNGQDAVVAPVGNNVEIFGMSKILVNEQFQMFEMENYLRADLMLEQILKRPNVKKWST